MPSEALEMARLAPARAGALFTGDEELVHDLEVDDVVDVEIKHRYYSRYSVSRVASLYV